MEFDEKILNNAILLIASDAISLEVKKIRTKYNIPNEGINDDNRDQFSKEEVMSCCAAVYDLCLKYNLPEPYFVPFMSLIVYSVLPEQIFGKTNNPIEYIIEKNRAGKEYLSIKIYPETSLSDIENNWSKIIEKVKEVYGYKLGRQRKCNTLHRDSRIRKFLKDGVKPKRLAEAVNKVFDNNAILLYNDMHSISSKLKKKANDKLEEFTKFK